MKLLKGLLIFLCLISISAFILLIINKPKSNFCKTDDCCEALNALIKTIDSTKKDQLQDIYNAQCSDPCPAPDPDTFLNSLDETTMDTIFGLNPFIENKLTECNPETNPPTCTNLYTWKNFKTAVEIWNSEIGGTEFSKNSKFPMYFNYTDNDSNKLLLCAIMANCKHESAGFNACKERIASKGYSQCKGFDENTCLCELDKNATSECPEEGNWNCSSGFTGRTDGSLTYCCADTGCEWGKDEDKQCYLDAWNKMSDARKTLFANKPRGQCKATCTKSNLTNGKGVQECVVCKDAWGETLNNAHCYFGRGPTQLTWSVNYKRVSDILDKIPDSIWERHTIEYIGVLLDPDSLCTYGVVAWLTALAYFTLDKSCTIIDNGQPNITCSINKLLSCVGAAAGNANSTTYFKDFTEKLEIQLPDMTNCDYTQCCESKGKDCDNCITNLPSCWGGYIPYVNRDTCKGPDEWCCVGPACAVGLFKCCGDAKCEMGSSKYSGHCVSTTPNPPPNACDKLGCPKPTGDNEQYADKWWCKNYSASSGSGTSNFCNGKPAGGVECLSKTTETECTDGCVWGNFGSGKCSCYSCNAGGIKKC